MSQTPPWHENFFEGLIVDSQKWIASHSPTQQEAEFIVQHLAISKGNRIADIPCGNGRLSLPLAEMGYAVEGVDISTGLLNDAKQTAKEKNLNVPFHQRDMRDLPWENEMDGAFCFGNSFSYFDEEGNRSFLKAVFRILKPGGRFILQSGCIAESILSVQPGRKWYPMNDLYFLHETQYDPLTSKQTSTYTLIRNDQVQKKQAIYHVYTCRELMKLMESIGFRVKEVFGSLKSEPFQVGSPWLLMVVEKP